MPGTPPATRRRLPTPLLVAAAVTLPGSHLGAASYLSLPAPEPSAPRQALLTPFDELEPSVR